MKNFHLVLLVLIVTMCIAPSCNKPSNIGEELLTPDQVEIAFIDSVSIVAMTIESDKLRIYDLNGDPLDMINPLQLDNFLCGDLEDPVFGGVKATNYLQNRLSLFSPGFQADDEIDSIVLAIVYDTIADYGNILEQHTISVHRLTENLDNDQVFYSDDAFMFDPMPLGTKTFTPDPNSPSTAIDYTGDEPSFDTLSPAIRIPLDIAFAQEMFDLEQTDSIFKSDSSFLAVFNGLYIESEGTNKESLLSFQYRNLGSRLQIYYTRDGTTKKQYDLIFPNSSVKSVNYDHYGASSSTAGTFLDDASLGDSLLFVQGMQGTNISFKFPHIANLNDLIINKATLELTVATLPGDDIEVFLPGQQLLLSEETDGELIVIEDVARATGALGGISVFGGNLQTDETLELKTYELNISATLQDMIKGDVSNEVVLSLFLSSQRANRSVVFGPKHSTFPAKLKVIYTNN